MYICWQCMIMAGHMSRNAYLKDTFVCRSVTFRCSHMRSFDYGIVKPGFYVLRFILFKMKVKSGTLQYCIALKCYIVH